jgi:hypothetical protein
MRSLCGLVNAFADLAHPKAALPLLRDAPRLSAYKAATEALLSEQPGNTLQPRCLVLKDD